MPKGLHKRTKENKFKISKALKEFYKNNPNTKYGFRKGHIPWNKDKKVLQISGERNPNWKGGCSKDKKYIRWQKGLQNKKRKRNIVGSHTFGEWETLKKQYGYRCPCCGRFEPEIKLTQDHIIPLFKGGSNYIENIQPLCHSCNSKKHTKVIKYQLFLEIEAGAV